MALSFDRTELRRIDPKSKDTVYGYIRQMQQILPSDTPYYNIPELVTFICLKFYYIAEYFHFVADTLSISQENQRLSISTWNFSSAYGSTIIHLNAKSKHSYIWKFRIIQSYHIIIGISNQLRTDTQFNYAVDSKYYGYECDGYSQSWKDGQGFLGSHKFGYDEDDQVTMIFDTKKRNLRFMKNDDTNAICKFDDIIDGDYRMAIGLYGSYDKDEVEMITVNDGIIASDIQLLDFNVL